MKTICFIGFLLLSFCLSAQRIKIHVTEALYSYSFDTTLLELLKNDSIEKVVKDVNSLYDLDLTEKTFKFYIGDELSWEDGLTFEKNGEMECVKLQESKLSYKTKMIKFKFYGRRKKEV